MTKKKGIIIVVAIIIVCISLVISIYMPNRAKLNEQKEGKEPFYLFKSEEKFGIINSEGEIVIQPEYDEIIIPNIRKAVFICDGEKILNANNEKIFTKYKNVEPIHIINNESKETYEQDVLKYEDDGKLGLIGFDGTIIVKAKYDEISSLGYKEGQILVKENNKYGILDSKGNQLIKTNYDSIETDKFYTEEGYEKSGYIVCNKTNEGYRYGYFDYEGNQILDTEYNRIQRVDVKNRSEIYLIAAKNGQYGVFANNNKIINTQYQSIIYNKNLSLFVVERTGKYGVLSERGVEVLKIDYSNIQIKGKYIYAQIEQEEKVFDRIGEEVQIEENGYQNIEYISDKYFIATNEDGNSGIIDDDGNIILEFKYDVIQIITSKNAIQTISFEEGKSEIYNSNLEKVLEMSDMNITTIGNNIKIYNNTEEHFLDFQGNIIEDENKLQEIKKLMPPEKIGDFKRVTDEAEQYYYIKD